jgi:hypothetical protein
MRPERKKENSNLRDLLFVFFDPSNFNPPLPAWLIPTIARAHPETTWTLVGA